MPDIEREIAIITTARTFDAEYEWSAHVLIAREVGVAEDVIDIVANRRPLSGLSEEHAVIVQFTRELLDDHRVSDAVFESVKKRFGDAGAVELTATVGYYSMIASVLNALEVMPAEGAPRLP